MKNEFNDVWDALEDDPVKRENLKLRSKLMSQINARIKGMGLNQVAAADVLNTTQPRMSALGNGKINEFRLDMLVDFATRLGLHVSIDVAA